MENTKENIRKFGLSGKSIVVQGDLFEKIGRKAHVIVLNHPFFPDNPVEGHKVSRAMLDAGNLIHRFFDGAKEHLMDGGVIVMPYYSLVGKVNNPALQGQEHGCRIAGESKSNAVSGLQSGEISIYSLKQV